MISFTAKSKFINKQWIWTRQILTRNVTDERSSHLAPYHQLAALLQKAQLKGEYNLISAKSTITMNEKFNFCERKDVSSLVTASFRARTAKRLKQEGIGFSSNDKSVNALVVLASHPGSGKTVNMGHLPCSKEFREYVEYRQSIDGSELSVSKLPPLVCLLGFNSHMSIGKDENPALGLRIVYAALHSTNNFAMKWDEFRDQYQSLEKLSGSLALDLLRRECGADRLIFLGVDELKKIESADSERGAGLVKAIAHELGVILDLDGRTDVLVTSLTPEFANKLATNCGRDIEYFSIHPLMNGELNKQFEPYGQRAVDQVKDLLLLKHKTAREKSLSIVNERIVRSMHLLASGHPRTVEEIAMAVDEGSVLRRVATLLTTRAVPNGYRLLKELAKMNLFTEFCSPPPTNKRREIVLSLRKRDVINDTELRMMLEENQCYLFKLAHCLMKEQEEEEENPRNNQVFVPTITLATFFRMIEYIDRDLRQGMHVGPLSRAVHVLFGQLQLPDTQFAALWERCCALDQVSRVNFFLQKGWFDVKAAGICGLALDPVEKFGFSVQLSHDLEVKVAVDKKDMQWAPNTLFVAPPDHPGFDLMLCVPGLEKREVFIYKEIKVQPLYAPSAKGQSIDELLAHKLRLTLQDHVERCGLGSLAVVEQLATLDNVLFVLSVYGAEWRNDRDAVLRHLMTAFKGEEELAGRAVEGVDLAIRFVEERWHQVAFQGTREIKALMLPVVQPVAQIVQAVVQE